MPDAITEQGAPTLLLMFEYLAYLAGSSSSACVLILRRCRKKPLNLLLFHLKLKTSTCVSV